MDQALLALLQCPKCAGELRATGNSCECVSCQTEFPEASGIPCLFPEPSRTMDDWRRAAEKFIEMLDGSVSLLDENLQRADLLPSTRRRLSGQRAAHAENGERMRALFRPAGLLPQGRIRPSERDLPLIEYYEQILRDWAWEDADEQHENARAADLVTATLGGETRVGKLLVLGAGPSRLSYDLHRRLAAELTVALDINPLLLLAARQVMFGGGLQFYEFPNDPKGLDTVFVEHSLRAPAGPPERLHLLLADAFAAPLKPGSFDTVLTPWFIDIVPVDVRETISLIHGLLAPGGRWLNYGPLSYPKEHPHPQRYSREELEELIRLAGFDFGAAGAPKVTTVDYMRSRSSARGKTAEVITFAAQKLATPAAGAAGGDPPAWLVLAHLPIPRFDGLDGYKPDHPMLKYLVSLIDGKRSANDIAARMIADHGARPDAALTGTRAMLGVLLAAVRGESK